ncbi:substrate-binding family protein [Chitinophaga skermanii]|uniref:Substrate-binding family protein n=2 Tax=Chitinophaga skermanii TaxID=331697 RepID=A0A327R484_9BACT|nr:substrate-binding family protein [Chitinophaga skermanii]
MVFCMMMAACKTAKVSTQTPTPQVVKKPTTEEKKEEKKPTVKAPFNVPAFAKEVKRNSYNIAVFAPLYLDSVFANSLDIPGRVMPRYVLPGLEFYEGVQLALDTLQKQGYKFNVFVYDSKAKQNDPAQLIKAKQLESIDLIIGSVSTPEIKVLSDFAKQKEINFVSATYPNDGGITENPFLFIGNSTLKSHSDAIQEYVQRGYANKNILVFRRNSALESRIAADIKAAHDAMQYDKKARIREVVWNENMTETELSQYLLTDRPNLCIIAALDEAGAKTILRKLSAQSSTYPMQIFGMPTWDVMKFKEPEFNGLTIYYSSPYYNDKNDAFSKYITENFRKTYRARPSDNAFKGFEFTYYFAKLLGRSGVYFNKDVNDSPYKVFTNFNFQPIYLKQGEEQPDYFENKNIYIIQKGDSADYKMNAIQ